MESYLMMLYVTLEQESALKNFFVDQGWRFCKPDLSVTTDTLGPSVKDVQTDGSHSESNTKLVPSRLGKRKRQPKLHLAPVVKLAKVIPASASTTTSEQTFDNILGGSEYSEKLDELHEAELQDIADLKGLSDVTFKADNPKVKVETFDASLNDDFDNDDDEDTDVDYNYDETKGEMEANVAEDNEDNEVGDTDEAVTGEATRARKPKGYKLSSLKFAAEDQTRSHIKKTSDLPSHKCTSLTFRNTDTNYKLFLQENLLKNSSQLSSHGVEKKAFQCKICNYSSASRGNLYRHQRVHTKSSVKCSKCEKSFADVYDQRQHFRSIHEGLKLLCEFCSKRFNNRFNLRRHFLMEHSKKLKYKCTFCEKQFYEKLCYLGHVNKHLDSRPYLCHICSKSFCYKTSLQRHIETLHQRQPKIEDFVCKTCGAIFKSKSILNDHTMGKHGQKTFVCNCGKAYSWRPSLIRHKKTCKILHN